VLYWLDSKIMPEDLSFKAEVNLYYDLHLVENAQSPAPLLIVTHGYAENKRWTMRIARDLAPEGFAIASLQGLYQQIVEPKIPDGPLRFGFGWLTNFKPEESIALHHKFLLDVIEKLTGDGTADKDKIFLLGFSQSCALDFRFALTHRNILKGIFGLCGGIPGDLETSQLFGAIDTPAYYLYGNEDKYVTVEKFEDNAKRLAQFTKDLQTKQYDAKHEISAEMRADVKMWLAQLTDGRSA
jgi:phospholipase/carboxylesterase